LWAHVKLQQACVAQGDRLTSTVATRRLCRPPHPCSPSHWSSGRRPASRGFCGEIGEVSTKLTGFARVTGAFRPMRDSRGSRMRELSDAHGSCHPQMIRSTIQATIECPHGQASRPGLNAAWMPQGHAPQLPQPSEAGHTMRNRASRSRLESIVCGTVPSLGPLRHHGSWPAGKDPRHSYPCMSIWGSTRGSRTDPERSKRPFGMWSWTTDIAVAFVLLGPGRFASCDAVS
jgi:hypothetical protein